MAQDASAFKKRQSPRRYSNYIGSNFTSGNNTPSKVGTPNIFSHDELQKHLLSRKNSTFAPNKAMGGAAYG